MTNYSIFVPNKKGHYLDYAVFLQRLLNDHNVIFIESIGARTKHIFDSGIAIFLDLEDKDVYWILLRSLFFRKSFAISVSLEHYLDESNFLRKIKHMIFRFIFRVLKKMELLKIISIHKDNVYEKKLENIASLFTYDIQYYDLKFLNRQQQPLKELEGINTKGKKTILIVNNTSSSKKNLDALYEFTRNSKKYYFIVIGKCDFLKGLELQKNFVCIERYISDEELLYVMNFVDIIYCYYNNNKPSGFMGRAMQLNKYVIVKENSYLASIDYGKSIKLNTLLLFDNYSIKEQTSNVEKYDASRQLRSFLTK